MGGIGRFDSLPLFHPHIPSSLWQYNITWNWEQLKTDLIPCCPEGDCGGTCWDTVSEGEFGDSQGEIRKLKGKGKKGAYTLYLYSEMQFSPFLIIIASQAGKVKSECRIEDKMIQVMTLIRHKNGGCAVQIHVVWVMVYITALLMGY